jgi:hypothetical protein
MEATEHGTRSRQSGRAVVDKPEKYKRRVVAADEAQARAVAQISALYDERAMLIAERDAARSDRDEAVARADRAERRAECALKRSTM